MSVVFLVTRRTALFKAPDSYRGVLSLLSRVETIIKGGGAV